MFVACSIMQYHKGNELLSNDRYIKVHLLQDLLFIANNLLLEAGKNVSNWVPSTQVIISRELHLKCNIIYCVTSESVTSTHVNWTGKNMKLFFTWL